MIVKPQRARLSRMDNGQSIDFLSNPVSLEDSKTAEYDEPEVSGAIAPPHKFKYGGPRQVRFVCVYVSQGNADVIASQIEFIRALEMPVKPKNEPPMAFLTIGGFQMPIRIREWKVTYNEWTTALKPKDLTVEVRATVDYKTPVPPPQPKPAETNKSAAKKNSKSAAPKIERIVVRGGTAIE